MMFSQDRVLDFIGKKLTVRNMVSSQKLNITDVCNFLGITPDVYEMIFGRAVGMKVHQIPPMVFENIGNLIKLSESCQSQRFHIEDLSTVSKDDVINFCMTDMYLLFSKKDLRDFWSFINFVTTSNVMLSTSKSIASEANLISIALKYQRAEIDLYERIWWYLTNMFAKIFSNQMAMQNQPEFIATFILSGKKCFFQYFNMIKNYQWDPSYDSKDTQDFEKLFFKYPSDRIPIMFLDTKLYPQKF